MKFNLKNTILALLALALSTSSCHRDKEENLPTEGNLTLKFENGFGNLGQIVLNNTTQTSSQNQKHQFSTLKYIISNVVLSKADGSEYQYNYNNPDLGAFIIDQADAVNGINGITLNKIPAGDYTKIRFGLGVSQKTYLLGADGQASFMKKAQDKGMFWSWSSGYIFAKLEGMYGPELKAEFMNHSGNKGNVATNNTADVYREISLTLPVSAKVNYKRVPGIHFKVDFNNYLSGKTPVLLTPTVGKVEGNDMDMGNGPSMVTLSNNLSQAFVVDHVHND
jgi:hypothetical protein